MNIKFVFMILPVLFMLSCIQETTDKYSNPSYLTDSESYYKDYPDETGVSDDDPENEIWDVRFSFLGVINDGNAAAENIQYGSGNLTYLDLEKNSISINSAMWAIKKSIKISSGHEVPIIQIFFADDPANTSEEGKVTYYILQLEGSSIAKSETYYLNNDKIYRAEVTLEEELIKEICYVQEPYSNKGRVTIFTHNIRVGEELRVEGVANMFNMEIIECKVLN
ncbi:MAG TPA: hypothetical protein PLX56_04610 [bacterium]|nr:hypothetical protein [bacterium]HQN73589.1 hypothetical protein [bacterium]HQO91594.1 hypothetical protein [bacterium]